MLRSLSEISPMAFLDEDIPAPILTVVKFDAARRQLQTAIELWFGGGDVVSIHTLLHAAYEVIHSVSKTRSTDRLLFDSPMIKEEYRGDVVRFMKKPGNFFKHARIEPGDATIEFNPNISEIFMLYALRGIQLSGENLHETEAILLLWLQFRRPEFFLPEARKLAVNGLPIDTVKHLVSVPRAEFFNVVRDALRRVDRPVTR